MDSKRYAYGYERPPKPEYKAWEKRTMDLPFNEQNKKEHNYGNSSSNKYGNDSGNKYQNDKYKK